MNWLDVKEIKEEGEGIWDVSEKNLSISIKIRVIKVLQKNQWVSGFEYTLPQPMIPLKIWSYPLIQAIVEASYCMKKNKCNKKETRIYFFIQIRFRWVILLVKALVLKRCHPFLPDKK